MNEANNTIQLADHKNTKNLDHHTMFEVDEKIGIELYYLQHLTQILLEVSDDMHQREALIGIIRDKAEATCEILRSMLEAHKK